MIVLYILCRGKEILMHVWTKTLILSDQVGMGCTCVLLNTIQFSEASFGKPRQETDKKTTRPDFVLHKEATLQLLCKVIYIIPNLQS